MVYVKKTTRFKNGKPAATSNYDNNGDVKSTRFHQGGQTAALKTLPDGTKIQVTHFDDGSQAQYRAYNPKTGRYDIPCDKNGKPIK